MPWITGQVFRYGLRLPRAEPVAGHCLSAWQIFLASKFSGYHWDSFGGMGAIFGEQLKRCLVDHFGFYLFHNVDDVDVGYYMDNGKYGR